MTKADKIRVLAEFREQNELKKMAEKRVKELREQILAEIEVGKYGSLVLDFEMRDVKEYVVPARTDKIVKVIDLNKAGAK